MSETSTALWKDVTLGDLAKGFRGVSYRPENLLDGSSDSAVTLLRATNIQQGNLTFDDVQFVPKWLVAPTQILVSGDIAVCMSNGSKALVGKCASYLHDANETHTVGAFCSIFKPVDVLEAEFVFHLFRSQTYQKNIDVVLAGSAINNLKNSSIESAVFRIPIDRKLRQKIAAILTSIDTAIEKTEALIAKYQQIKAGLMHDLFTRGVLPNGQLRPPREQAPELYQETAIGWIPKGWSLTGLSAKGRQGTSWIRTGPFGSALKGEHWRVDGHPVITIGSLGIGEFIASELLFVGPKDATRLSDFQLKTGDVVFSRVADVGRSVVVREAQAGWIMSSNLMRISVNPAQLRPDYLQMQLADDPRVKAQIRASVNSGGRDVANSEVLNRLRFVCPEPSEQDRVISTANQLTERLNVEMSMVAKRQTQKLGLMQDLLTGKVQVKVHERTPELLHA